MNQVAAAPAWISATVASGALTWAIVSYLLARVADARREASSVMMWVDGNNLLIQNFGDTLIRDVSLRAPHAPSTELPRNFLPPRSEAVCVEVRTIRNNAVPAFELTYRDVRAKWWVQVLGHKPVRYAPDLLGAVARLIP